jgi:hypothetical protein
VNLRHATLILGVLLLFEAISLTTAPAAEGFMLRVTAENAAIKSEGSELARVPKGTRLWCFSVKENLAEVKVPEKNDHGWLELSQVEEIQPSMVEKSKLQKAEEHHERSLELSKEEQYNDASKEEQYDDAKREIEAALAITREVRGSDHPKVADLLIALGSLEKNANHEKMARSSFQEAFDIRQSALGSNFETWNALYYLDSFLDKSLKDELYAQTDAPQRVYLIDLSNRTAKAVKFDKEGNL